VFTVKHTKGTKGREKKQREFTTEHRGNTDKDKIRQEG
jgi:hypothetical protein